MTIRIISDGLKIDPSNTEVAKTLKFRRGKTYFETNRFTDAIKDFTDVLKFDPANVDAFMLRAKSYLAISLLDDAIIDLIEIDKLSKCSRMLAEAEALRKRIGRAIVPKTNYELLDVARHATHSDIVRSFESLSILHRVNMSTAGTDAEKRKFEFLFKRIDNAHAILSDEKLKQNYDKLLEEQESKCSIM